MLCANLWNSDVTELFGLRFDVACIEYSVGLPLAHFHICGSLGKGYVAEEGMC